MATNKASPPEIPGYELQQLIHSGKNSLVYRGTEISSGRKVVLKTPRSPYPTDRELAALRRSFEIAKALESAAVVENLELLRLEGPLGSYYLREESSRPIIMVGGGTGFAPLKGMLEHAFQIQLDRPIHLFCGARALRDLYMDEMVKGWIKEHGNLKYTPVLSEPDEEDSWQGWTGFVHEVIIEQYPDLSGYDIYMSGPPPMIKPRSNM